MEEVIYFDNAASSWPKPPEVIKAMNEVILQYSANPGRGSHKMAVKASRALFETRKNIAKLFHINNPNDISFGLNTTMALNQAIKGFLKDGDHVISTGIEHNSVRRPLEYLKSKMNIEVSYLPTDARGNINPEDISAAVREQTRLLVCSHSSNLMGTLLPIGQISEVIRKHDIKLLVDAAQTAGTYPIDVGLLGIDMLAFPGHKGLLGPQGTGGLYVHPSIDLEPFMHGGTGSQSEMVEQPTVRPDRYESGTQNTTGIAGLNEGVKFILNEKVENIHNKEWNLTQRLMEGLSLINGLEIIGPRLGEDKTGITSFYSKNIDSSEVAFILDQSFNIAVRSGYHCTPLAHECAGTIETGAVRASVGYFTTEAEVDHLIHAVKEIYEHLK
jgi:cysteine desulfurase family protein